MLDQQEENGFALNLKDAISKTCDYIKTQGTKEFKYYLPLEIKNHLFKNNALKKGFIMTSNLDNSALLGAGISAIYH